MAVPDFTNDGVLPPFLGEEPGMNRGLMSPYLVSSIEVIERFGTNRPRLVILEGWLALWAELRKVGFRHGFQWIDGSFVEEKLPKDIDVVTFLYEGLPSFANPEAAWEAQGEAPDLFDREFVKATYRVDSFPIDLLGEPELTIDVSRYFFGLFSHQRFTMIWKGILQVRLEDDDEAATVRLTELIARLNAADPPIPQTMSLFRLQGAADAS